jgi:hypothetical protein
MTFGPLWVNSYSLENASEFDHLRKTIIKYYLEEHFGIYVQMKVIDLQFWILYV